MRGVVVPGFVDLANNNHHPVGKDGGWAGGGGNNKKGGRAGGGGVVLGTKGRGKQQPWGVGVVI